MQAVTPGSGQRTGPRKGTRPAVPAGEIARLYRLGLTMSETARACAISPWMAAARLDAAGISRRSPAERAGLPVERAVRAYRRQPHRLAELAARLGIDPQLIADRAARPAPAQRGHGSYRADVRAADVAARYRQGATVTQIAASYHVAAATIISRLQTAGVTRRPRSSPAAFPAGEAARRVVGERASFAALAREYGVSQHAVRRQLAARGIGAAAHAPRVLTGVAAADIARLYADGLSVRQIADMHGVSRWAIAARLNAAGAARRPAGKPFPLDEAAAAYQRGASLAALGARYGMSAATVSGKLTAAGIGLRPPGRQPIAIPVAEAVSLYAAGCTMASLAARYGVCESVICNRLTRAGAPIRHRAGNTGNFKQVDANLLAALAAQIGIGALP